MEINKTYNINNKTEWLRKIIEKLKVSKSEDKKKLLFEDNPELIDDIYNNN